MHWPGLFPLLAEVFYPKVGLASYPVLFFSSFPSFLGVAAPFVVHESANGEVRAVVEGHFAVDVGHPVAHVHLLLFPFHTILRSVQLAVVHIAGWDLRYLWRLAFALAFASENLAQGWRDLAFSLDPDCDFSDLLRFFSEYLRRPIAESSKLEERCSRLRRHFYIISRLRGQSKHLANATVNRSELEARRRLLAIATALLHPLATAMAEQAPRNSDGSSELEAPRRLLTIATALLHPLASAMAEQAPRNCDGQSLGAGSSNNSSELKAQTAGGWQAGALCLGLQRCNSSFGTGGLCLETSGASRVRPLEDDALCAAGDMHGEGDSAATAAARSVEWVLAAARREELRPL